MANRLAIIDSNTDIVVNTIIPPQGTDAYFIPVGFYGVMTDVGNIGDTYDEATQVFVRPPQPEQVDEPNPALEQPGQ